MRLSTFILQNMEPILQEWEDFARTVETPALSLNSAALRNHAEHILQTVALEMLSPQTPQQQIDKSQGLGPVNEEETAAQTHAALRLIDGFTLDQMISEYRALRSSVLRLWLTTFFEGDAPQIEDITRFNEGIDQALVESVASYGRMVESTRKMVLAILSHDLRSPLAAVLMGTQLLSKNQRLSAREKYVASQVTTSALRANQMISDLLDLARCNLGAGIPVSCEDTDLNVLCESVIRELRLGHPGAKIIFEGKEQLCGKFDPGRMAQVFSNLVGNAVRHGDLKQPISVTLSTENASVLFLVRNFGKPIPPQAIPYLFNPESRYSTCTMGEASTASGLGLGLFIASEIVASHDGKIEVESSPSEGTCFKVVLPVR